MAGTHDWTARMLEAHHLLAVSTGTCTFEAPRSAGDSLHREYHRPRCADAVQRLDSIDRILPSPATAAVTGSR